MSNVTRLYRPPTSEPVALRLQIAELEAEVDAANARAREAERRLRWTWLRSAAAHFLEITGWLAQRLVVGCP